MSECEVTMLFGITSVFIPFLTTEENISPPQPVRLPFINSVLQTDMISSFYSNVSNLAAMCCSCKNEKIRLHVLTFRGSCIHLMCCVGLSKLHALFFCICVCALKHDGESISLYQDISNHIYRTPSVWFLLSYGLLSFHGHVKGQLPPGSGIEQVRP